MKILRTAILGSTFTGSYTKTKKITLNVLFLINHSDGVEQIKEAYISNHNSKRKIK